MEPLPRGLRTEPVFINDSASASAKARDRPSPLGTGLGNHSGGRLDPVLAKLKIVSASVSSCRRSYALRAALSWTCSTARRIIGVARRRGPARGGARRGPPLSRGDGGVLGGGGESAPVVVPAGAGLMLAAEH